MLRILPKAVITVRMLVAARMIIIKPCLLLLHKKEKNKRGSHQQNLRDLIQGILPPQKNKSRKVTLIKAPDFKYLNLRVKNGRLRQSPV